MPSARILIVLAAVLILVIVLVVAVGRGVSWLGYQRDHPTEANQFLTLFLLPKSPEMSSYFPDAKVAAFAQDVRNGRARGVKQALASGIDVNAEGNKGFRPIFFAVYPHQDATVLRLLLAAGANPNVHLSNGATPLHMAVQLPTTDHAAALLDAGADANARGEYDQPVIHLVLRDGSDMVRLLAKHHADLNIVWGGSTPLMGSIITYQWELATTFLELGADTHYKDLHGQDAASVFCEQVQAVPASDRNRRGIPPLAKAFADRGVRLPCAQEIDKFR